MIKNPSPSSPQPSSGQPKSSCPTIQNPSPSLPSNHFPKRKKKKKNRTKRERGRSPSESVREPPTVTKRKARHLNLRSTPPPSGPCLSPSICPVFLFLPVPPMSPIYPFSLYPCRANHHKTSDPPWPSRLRRAILPPPPLDQTQSPLSLSLSLFLLLSIWPDSMNFFFVGFCFLCLSIEKWYYIFVWKLRKYEQQVENVFSIVFSRTQPNTKKYFSNYFLKCHQAPENILHWTKHSPNLVLGAFVSWIFFMLAGYSLLLWLTPPNSDS